MLVAALMPVICLLMIAVIVPATGPLLCGLALLIQVAVALIRILSARTERTRPLRPEASLVPIFSVHVPTHDEPPQMVASTLRALAEQDWPAASYEVIVIDNNTADPAMWEPVERTCEQLGPKFRFQHRMGVKGAKAGALNIALEATRSDATHIVTVDADYCVAPGFLTAAARSLRHTGADYIQFPQAYAGCGGVAAGVDSELDEYFRNAEMADVVEAVLLTGTLSVISKTALEAVGGWSGRTTTEDAEMGVRLCRNGFNGRFIPTVVGRGLLPFSLRDLERQRHRWASGNLQTLIAHAPAILFGNDELEPRRRGAILSQLTAWLNFSLVPAALLLLALLTGRSGAGLIATATASILLSFSEIVVRLSWRGLLDGAAPMVSASALANRIALAPASAMATVDVLLGRPLGFVVTNKFAGRRRLPQRLPLGALALFGFAAAAMVPALEHGWPVAAAVLVLMLPLPAAMHSGRTLERYREIHSIGHRGASA